jgi:hypothetical protein
MYIRTTRRVRRPLSGLGWTGGFTLPGSATRYSTEKCTGSAATPMTGGDTICGMPSESAYLNSIGCVAVGFQGEHDCSTDSGNAGAIYCCPAGALAAAQAGRGGASTTPPTPDSSIPSGLGISTTQILGLAGVAAVIGVIGYMLTRKQGSSLPELTPEQEQWADESASEFGRDLREYGRKYGLED